MRAPSAFPPVARQWHSEVTLAAYSCGGSRGIEDRPVGASSHRVPFFTRRNPHRAATGTVTRGDGTAMRAELSTEGSVPPSDIASGWRNGHGVRAKRRQRTNSNA
jgi:hypothetical protein